MASFIGGVLAVILGIVGLVRWWIPFLLVLRGMVPAILILCGAVAVGAGFGAIKDKMKCGCGEKKEEPKEESKEAPKEAPKEEAKEEPAQEEKKES